jgi:hypothetical protein
MVMAMVGCGSGLLSGRTSRSPGELWVVRGEIAVPRTSEGVVDTEALEARVRAEVQRHLPRAYLRAFVFGGQAEGLTTLDGSIVYGYMQRSGVVRKRIVLAHTRIETEAETIRITATDYTGYSILTEPMEAIVGLPPAEIAQIAYDQLHERGLDQQMVTLTWLDRGTWVLVCGELGTLERKCKFEIEPESGEVTVLKP